MKKRMFEKIVKKMQKKTCYAKVIYVLSFLYRNIFKLEFA